MIQLHNVRLFEELSDYSKYVKAGIVYKDCIRSKKYDLAEKIKRKYNLQEPHDDMMTAIGYAINSLKK